MFQSWNGIKKKRKKKLIQMAMYGIKVEKARIVVVIVHLNYNVLESERYISAINN
jgi:hypothetical protein